MKQGKSKSAMLLGMAAAIGAGVAAGGMPASAEATEKSRIDRRASRRASGPNPPIWTGYAKTSAPWDGMNARVEGVVDPVVRDIIAAAIAKRARKAGKRASDALRSAG